MTGSNMMAKKMKKKIRKIISLVPFPANMTAVQAFLSEYSTDVRGIDTNSCVDAESEKREIIVSFFNGDLLSVIADGKDKNTVEYTIDFDSVNDSGFYLTKEGIQPWIE